MTRLPDKNQQLEQQLHSGSEVPSPCVRNCCLDEMDICLGCGRSLAQIVRWGNSTNEEKRAILAQIGKLSTKNE